MSSRSLLRHVRWASSARIGRASFDREGRSAYIYAFTSEYERIRPSLARKPCTL
jgi:hypothetical protein